MRLPIPPTAPAWMFDVFRQIEKGLDGSADRPWQLQSLTVAGLPDPAQWPDALVMVSDEVGGEIPAFSDGLDWRRVSDRAVVS